MNRPIDVEVERYELDEASPYRFEVGRREFMRIFSVMGGGLLVVASTPAAAQESGRTAQQAASAEVSAWVHIDEHGRITGYTGKTEIGQNIRTSLAQAIADELRVPLDRVSLVMADTDLVPFDMGDESVLRDLRLRALADAPEAFGSTYERELARSTDDWRRWLSPGATFILEDREAARGLVACARDAADASVVHLMEATAAIPASGEFPDVGLVGGSATVGTVTFSLAQGGNSLAIGTGGIPGIPDWYPLMPGNEIALGYENLQVQTAVPVFALGFDFVEPNATMPAYGGTPVDSTFEIVLYMGNTEVGRSSFNAPDDQVTFVGVWSSTAFNRVTIIDKTGNDDDEYFGQFYTGTVKR